MISTPGSRRVQRHYLYRIVNRRADLALDAGRALRVPRPLDAAAMHDAAQRLVGRHDFTTFRAAECQAKSPLKTLDRLDVERHGDELRIHASARSFLHHQVRSMVGSLVQVGDGRWSADDLARALAARDRRACGPVAPPDGLYLVRVDYPARARSGRGRSGYRIFLREQPRMPKSTLTVHGSGCRDRLARRMRLRHAPLPDIAAAHPGTASPKITVENLPIDRRQRNEVRGGDVLVDPCMVRLTRPNSTTGQ